MKKGKETVLGVSLCIENTEESAPVAVSNNGKKDSPLVDYQWRPGQSGNPAGRPKTSDLKAEVRSFADEEDPKLRKTRLRQWLEMADRRARQGSPKHLELLLAYGWGKPPQAIEVDGSFCYTEVLTQMRERRDQLALPAANGHGDAQMAQEAAMPDQALTGAKEDDAEQPDKAPQHKKIVWSYERAYWTPFSRSPETWLQVCSANCAVLSGTWTGPALTA